MRVAPTNGEFKALLGPDVICTLVYHRLRAIAQWDKDDDFDPLWAVRENLVDPVRLFVKNELHSAEKVRTGRMRLISSVSCIDQMVEKILGGDQNRAEIAGWTECPSKPGLGLHDEGLALILEEMKLYSEPIETDVSGWDWSVKQWMLDFDADCRALLGCCELNGAYHKMLRNRAGLLGKSVLIQSNGSLWVQVIPGIMKSGSGWTSSTNSRARVGVAYCAGVGRIMAMGDDAVENKHPEAKRIYEEYGLMIKEYKQSSLYDGGIEFCSIGFGPTVEHCAPVRWLKLLGTLLQKKPKDALHQEELMVAFRYDMRHSPFLDLACSLIVQSGWGLHKYDGEEGPYSTQNRYSSEEGTGEESSCC